MNIVRSYAITSKISFLQKVKRIFSEYGLSGIIWRIKDKLLTPQTRYSYVKPLKPELLSEELRHFHSHPLLSIVVPTYNTPVQYLEELIQSVESQWYENWEIIFSDDNSTSKETRQFLNDLNVPKIKVIKSDKNGGISQATNLGIQNASGEYIVFVDHDDLITVDCLYEIVKSINRQNPDFIYSDEDKLTQSGKHVDPHFKPDWSPDTIMSLMYVCHVSCMRTSLIKDVGGLRSEYDGSQDWDLVLRVTEKTNRIHHIPKVLYHWRIIPNSAASDILAKPYAISASVKLRQDALKRRGLKGRLEPVKYQKGYYRVAYDLIGTPLISIIIPTRDNSDILKQCVNSILKHSKYKNYEIIIVDNGSRLPSTLSCLNSLNSEDKIKIVRCDIEFNFSKLCNFGAHHSKGEFILFLNDDTEIIQGDWLGRLGGYAQLSHIGAVGAKLLYPNGRIQHVGITNHLTGPNQPFQNLSGPNPGYFMRCALEYDWLAVTGACLMVSRSKFNLVNGFCEDLAVAYNDVDLCLKLSSKGYYNITVPAVTLKHYESFSRGSDQSDSKKERLAKERDILLNRHPEFTNGLDPFFNHNALL